MAAIRVDGNDLFADVIILTAPTIQTRMNATTVIVILLASLSFTIAIKVKCSYLYGCQITYAYTRSELKFYAIAC
jgi:hypothetical protein